MEKYEESSVGAKKRQKLTWLGEEVRVVFLEMIRFFQVKKQGKSIPSSRVAYTKIQSSICKEAKTILEG